MVLNNRPAAPKVRPPVHQMNRPENATRRNLYSVSFLMIATARMLTRIPTIRKQEALFMHCSRIGRRRNFPVLEQLTPLSFSDQVLVCQETMTHYARQRQSVRVVPRRLDSRI